MVILTRLIVVIILQYKNILTKTKMLITGFFLI